MELETHFINLLTCLYKPVDLRTKLRLRYFSTRIKVAKALHMLKFLTKKVKKIKPRQVVVNNSIFNYIYECRFCLWLEGND